MSIFDKVDFFKDHPPPPQPGEFSKGIRSGTLGLGAGFSSAAGAIADSLGAPEFSQRAYATADDLSQQAAAAAPRITSIRDIGAPGGRGVLRDTGDWVAGTLGNVVPSAALGIGAGLAAPVVGLSGLGGALAAGTAAYTLPETGDVVSRMRALGQPVDTGKALGLGALSAAGQSIVPGLVGAKLAGQALRTGPMTLSRAGGSLATSAGLEGGSEGGSEALKQAGLGQPLDWGQIADNAAAGVVGGAAMGGLGVAGEYAHSRAGDVSKGLQGAKDAATGLLGSAKDKLKGAEPAADAAKAKLGGFDFFDDLSTRWDDAKVKAKDTLRKIADSEDVIGDAQKFAGLQGEKLKAAIAGDDGERAKAVRSYYDELTARNLSPENKAVLDEWVADPGNHAKQAAVAGMKWAGDKAAGLRDRLKGLADRVVAEADRQRDAAKFKKGSGGDVDTPDPTLKQQGGPKKSEDYSAADAAIFREIAPLLQESRPELFTNAGQEELLDAGRVIRGLLKTLSTGGRPDSDTIAELIDILGPKATDMIEAGYRAVGDKAEPAKFFEGLTAIDEARRGRDDIVGVLRGQLKPQFQKIVDDAELGLEARSLEKWATDTRKSADDPEFQYRDRKQREALAVRYENPETVLAAIEARLGRPEEGQIERARPETDEEGNVIGVKGGHGQDREIELSGQKLQLHTAKGGLMYLHPEHDTGRGGNLPAAAQRMARIREQGGAQPRMLSMDELGVDHPLVQKTYDELVRRGNLAGIDGEKFADEEIKKYVAITTEVSDSPQSVSPDEVREMTLDTHKYGKSKSRLDTGEGGPILDGMRVQRFMQARFKDEYAGNDDKSRVVRMGRMFVEGVAAVQEHLGRSFPVPDSVVIGRSGGEDITFGDARKYDVRTEEDKASTAARASAENKLAKLRAAFREADNEQRKAILQKAEKVIDERDFAKNRELTIDDARFVNEDALDFQSETSQGITDLNKVRRRELEAKLVAAQNAMEKEAAGGKPNPARAGWVQLLQEGVAFLSNDAESNTGAGVGYAIRNLLTKIANFEKRINEAPSPNARRALRERVTAMEAWLKKMQAEDAQSMRPSVGGSGQSEIDPFGQIHQAAGFNERRDPVPFQQAGGAEAGMGEVQAPRLLGARRQRAAPQVAESYDMPGEAAQRKALADEYADTEEQSGGRSPSADEREKWLTKLLTKERQLDIIKTIDRLTPQQLNGLAEYIEGLAKPPAGVSATRFNLIGQYIMDKADAAEAPPSPKVVAAKKAALLEKARSGDGALLKTLASSNDAAGLQRAVAALAGEKPDANVQAAIDTANDRLGELVRGSEDVAYGLQTKRYSAQQTTPGNQGPVNRQEVYAYLHRVLSPQIRVAWKNFLHAGEFERVTDPQGMTEDIIRLSIHSMNPLSPAYHESLHAFFERLRDLKQGQVMDVLEKAGSSAAVMSQLKRLLANEPAALAQLNNAEERAAYMYQFWAMGQLTVGPATQNVFQRIAEFIRSVLGIWSNDQRALHIMEYFHSGEFATDAQGRAPRDAVSTKLMGVGRNAVLETTRRMTEPLLNLGESLMVAGGQRLRDTGIPALRELADAMKLHGTSEGDDPGFIPAARTEFAQRMNALATKLKDVSEAQLLAAVESLQTKSNAPIDALATPEQRLAARKAKAVMREHLDSMRRYMRSQGVDVNDMGYGQDYFPRIYDSAYISSHQAEFKAVLAAHGVTDADATMQKIVTNDGNEFAVTDKPGMQHLKPRKLAHIPDTELAPFMVKNGLEVMSSYTMQATRRGEWAARFGDDSGRITALLVEAQREGATPDQLKAAQNFVRAVDGTLGDTISPEARRLMGNMIVYQNIRLLPLAIFSSVVDPMGVMVRGGTLSESFNTFRRGMREVVKNFKKTATDDDMTRLAEEIGTIDNVMLTQTLSALYLQGMAGRTAKKINDTFFRYNLMEQWTRSARVGATEAAIGFLTRHATGTRSPHSTRWLNELGLQPGDVRLNAQGRAMITEADGLTPAEAARMKVAVNRWVDGAVLRPDAADKPVWMSDPHWALVAHLKQFTFSFQETILKRVGHEFDHGNYVPAMALSSYVPIMIASDLVKGLIQGGGEQPEWKSGWSLWDYFMSGVERSGLYGTGQFTADALGGNVGALAGPTIEQLAGAVQVIGGNVQFDRFALKSMPANALYREAFSGEEVKASKFVE